jgi:hypothetical protein
MISLLVTFPSESAIALYLAHCEIEESSVNGSMVSVLVMRYTPVPDSGSSSTTANVGLGFLVLVPIVVIALICYLAIKCSEWGKCPPYRLGGEAREGKRRSNKKAVKFNTHKRNKSDLLNEVSVSDIEAGRESG